jgi:hypothetical protein
MLAAVLAGTAWLQGSEIETIELDPSGPYRIRSTTGPVEVTTGDRAVVSYSKSWLVGGPTATAESGDLLLRCQTRWPCRASSTLTLPPGVSSGTTLELSGDQDLLVSEFDGTLVAAATGDGDVVLGPIGGKVTAETERGAILGYGLRATEMDLKTTDGVVELDFLERPQRVSIQSGPEAVTITLPPGDYAVSVTGGSSIAINVGQAAEADSQITIHARGPVRIDHAR